MPMENTDKFCYCFKVENLKLLPAAYHVYIVIKTSLASRAKTLNTLLH